jgi:hypothetical protein
MLGRIAHLRSHYRLTGAQVAAPAVALQLDRILREEALRSCDEALDSALALDESVYVLRRVKVKTSFVLSSETTDAGLGKRWGSHLATAVMRAIARGEDAAGNVVRFENQAVYVASFLSALLQGTEHKRWFYSAFAYVETFEKQTAIRRVLRDNISHAPAILACVHRHGEIDSLLATLDAETKQAVWSPESEQRDDLEISRSLFTTGLQLVKRLAAASALSQSAAELFGDFPENDPPLTDWRDPRSLQRPESGTALSKSGDELFGEYWETYPPFADWRDPRSLAESVLEVIRYFVARNYLAPPEAMSELSLRLEQELEVFEWLDREWLRSSILELFEKRDPVTPDLPLRVSTGRATPRQRELLATIAAAVGDANVVNGDFFNNDSLAASLKILALLVNAAPGWAEDAAAKVMIENLLAARTAAQTTPARAEFFKLLQRRDVEGALHCLPLEQRDRARDACRSVAALGKPALELLDRLTKAEVNQAAVGIASECAGASLLVRTMLDARLHTLPDEDAFPVTSEWPQPAMLFLAIALRLNGEKAFVNETLEPGLCVLAGFEQAPTRHALDEIWREAETTEHSRFREALLRIAEGHRLEDLEHSTTSFNEALAFPDDGQTGNPSFDLTIAAATRLLLRMWARWLRGFSNSSPAFLSDNFIRRRGQIYVEKDVLLIELEQRPLDVVVEMAGYLADLERVPWLPGKRIKFALRGS